MKCLRLTLQYDWYETFVGPKARPMLVMSMTKFIFWMSHTHTHTVIGN